MKWYVFAVIDVFVLCHESNNPSSAPYSQIICFLAGMALVSNVLKIMD